MCCRLPGAKKKDWGGDEPDWSRLEGRRTIDVLAGAREYRWTAIFSPEHGVTGTLDTTDINSSKDAATGVPVYSVYGAKDAERRPAAEVMK